MKYYVLSFIIILAVSGCKNNDNTIQVFTAWDKAKVYGFLNEVFKYTREIPQEAKTKEEIIKKYERYFSPELSGKIVDSLYIKSDKGWFIPDGDSGYSFYVPEESELDIEFNKENIIVRESHEIGLYSLIEYTIQFDGKPIITDWIKK
jgi:hypothetical protein